IRETMKNVDAFFVGCPSYQRSLAEFGLRHLRLLSRGEVIQRLTAAFWDDGDNLSAAVPWDDVLRNGANLIRIELIEDTEAALSEWAENYQMSPEQVAFVRQLYERKISRPAGIIELSQEEVKWLESTFEDPKQIHLNAAKLLTDKGNESVDLGWLD